MSTAGFSVIFCREKKKPMSNSQMVVNNFYVDRHTRKKKKENTLNRCK